MTDEMAGCYHVKVTFPQISRFFLPENHEQLVSRCNRTVHKGFVRNKKSMKISERFTILLYYDHRGAVHYFKSFNVLGACAIDCLFQNQLLWPN